MTTYLLRILLLLVFCSCTVLSSCQTKKKLTTTSSSTKQDYLIEGQFKYLTCDKLGHTYLVSLYNEILQLKDDKILFRYSNKRLGDIKKIDVSNPQKILVYYSDYYQIVFLDNTLSEIKRLDLQALGYWNVEGVALSRDNQIWIYDPTKVRLHKMSDNGKIRLSSNELWGYGFSEDFSPDIVVSEEQVFVYDDSSVKVFDEFGVWQTSLPLQNEGLQASKGYLFFKENDQLMSYNLEVQFKDPTKKIIDLPTGLNGFYFLPAKVLMIDQGGLFTLAY